MKIVATTPLPAVDRPNADRWNGARSRQNADQLKKEDHLKYKDDLKKVDDLTNETDPAVQQIHSITVILS